MNYTSKEIFDFMRKYSLVQSQVDAFYKLLEQGADINTIALFAGLSPKDAMETQPVEEKKEEKKLSNFKLSQRSLNSLNGVDPNLVKVVKRAIELTEQDFIVIEGLRTREQMMINYGKGRTAAQLAVHGIPASYAKPKEAKVTWLNDPFASNHAKGKAVDIVPSPVDWNDISKFRKINEAMQAAAKELGVKLSYGGDWTKKDYPHWELA